jgi:hypothetical protein
LSTAAKKPKRRQKSPEGKVVIGKNIPFHWGKSEIVAWEVHDESMGMIESYKTKKEACIMFPYLKQTRTSQTPSKICPLLKFEKAIMNPYVVDWSNCFVPTEEDMKPPKRMIWAVKGWSQEKGRWITCGHLQSQEISPLKLRGLAIQNPKIISKADKLNIMKSEQPELKYWFIFELEDWEE